MGQLSFRADLFPTAPEGDLTFNNGAPGSAVAEWVVSVAHGPISAPSQWFMGAECRALVDGAFTAVERAVAVALEIAVQPWRPPPDIRHFSGPRRKPAASLL